LKFPSLSERTLATRLSKYKENELPPHLLAALNILRYSRWAEWKIERQKLTNCGYKREISAFSKRIQQLRLELDELKYDVNPHHEKKETT
jgi:hypothetical protein